MDIINIQNWTNAQVLLWFGGLDESLRRYESHLKAADIVGEQLLSLSHEDLHNLRINLVGHQELILDAVSLLQQLDFGLDSETLQSRALCLKCRCRGLRSTVATRRREAEEYEYDGGVSLQRGATNQLLHLASDVLDEGKQLVLWLDRAPFNSKPEFRTLRDKMVQLCYELSVTMQQSVFACVIEDASLNICTEMENSADSIVQSSDSLTIQPVSLEQVYLRDVNPEEGLGLFIKATFEGHHVVTGTRNGSIASRMRKITSGDEVIAVNGKAVVGWTLGSLVAALKEQPHEVSLLMKKRPQTLSSSSSNLLALFQRNENDRSKLIRAANPVKRIDTPTVASSNRSSNCRPVSARSSLGTWSSHKSHEPMQETSSERMTSGSDMSDQRRSTSTNGSGNSSLNEGVSKPVERTQLNYNHVATPREQPRRSVHPRVPSISAPHPSKDPASPIEVLDIPPPPSEPYTPKSNHLSVEQATGSKRNSRSASPNSMMDIEHRRRYTVIGGSTVDQAWYEDFLAEVNKCNFASSSGRPSQEKISSNEEVFTYTPPSKNTSVSSLYQQHQRNLTQNHRRSKNDGRPASMPPDYYCPANRVDLPVNHPLTSHRSSQGPTARRYSQTQRTTTVNDRLQARNNRIISSSNYNANKPHQQLQSRQYTEHFKRESHRSRYNNNNNNNNDVRGSSLDRPSDSSARSSQSSKNPPKPPPRSSSITKLSHRLSSEIRERVDHSRQSSLPVDSSHSMVEENRQNSLPLQKPAIPRKPSRIRPVLPGSKPTVNTDKKVKSQSTPHLNNQRKSPEIEQVSTRQLSASENKLKYSPKQTDGNQSVEASPRCLNIHTAVPATIVNTKTATTKNTATEAPPEHPVPKPRTNRKKLAELKAQDEFSSRGRSNSQGVLLAPSDRPVPAGRMRRKSAGHVTQKTKIETILDEIKHEKKNDEQQKGSVAPPWRSLASRHSPTRGSYNAAIKNAQGRYEMSAPQSRYASDRVPQLNDSYDFKVIAGVPVRLRKSISRLANNKLKTTPEKGRANQSSSATAGMKGDRRVSCRDLGCGDCQGWLWKKKSGVDSSSGGPLSIKWAKRWVVIKDRAIYCYRSNSEDDNQRAECYISLPGYKVAPAPECKRKFAFHISHLKRKTFFFAAERQMDMSRWMNKMGLAAIEYKFEAPKENGEKMKDEDYYSESDEDRLSPEKSCNSTLEKRQETTTERDGVNGSGMPPKPIRTQTIAPTSSPRPNGDLRTRSQSESVKSGVESEQSESLRLSESALANEDGLGPLPPSPRRKPAVKPGQRRHRGNLYRRPDLSRSLDSLIKAREMTEVDADSKPARYKKAREMAAEKAEILKKRQMCLTSPSITVNLFDETSQISPLLDKTVSLSTFYFGDSVDQQSLNATSSINGALRTHSLSSPALSSVDSHPLNVSRRDVAGRPKVNFSPSSATNSSTESPTHQASPPKPSPQDQAALLKAELSKEDPLDDMCKSLKQSEIDLRGISRRTTLRRKMTILSRDPQINERMLRKRALERELKAKELELAYFDKLLSKENISRVDLHAWINQHPSLVAELGTIRRISKKQRHPLPEVSGEGSPPGGDKPPLSSSEDDANYSTSGSERDSRLMEDSFAKNSNNNNNNIPAQPLSRKGRPRSSAFGERDHIVTDSQKFHSLDRDGSPLSDKSRTSSSVARRRKIVPKRKVAARSSYDKPYLETDL